MTRWPRLSHFRGGLLASPTEQFQLGSLISHVSTRADILMCICWATGPSLNWFGKTLEGKRRGWKETQQEISRPTCPVQINECLRPKVIMEASATVLLQLDLLDPHCLGDQLTRLFLHTDAVCQAPIYCDWEPLLGNLVACLHTNTDYRVTVL